MQKNKKILLAIIFILTIFIFYYRYSVMEIYYGITGKVVKEKISQEAMWSENLLSLGNIDLENDRSSREICFVRVSRPNCTLIRASITNWAEHVKGTSSVDIVCTYGCPK